MKAQLLILLLLFAACGTDEEVVFETTEQGICSPWVCPDPENMSSCYYAGCPAPGQTLPPNPSLVQQCEYSCSGLPRLGLGYWECIAGCAHRENIFGRPGPLAPRDEDGGFENIGPHGRHPFCRVDNVSWAQDTALDIGMDTFANHGAGYFDCFLNKPANQISHCRCLVKLMAQVTYDCNDPIRGRYGFTIPEITFMSDFCFRHDYLLQPPLPPPPPPPAPPGGPPGGGLDPCNNCPAPQADFPDDTGACLLLPEPHRTWCLESPTPPPPPRRHFPEPIPPPWVTP